MTREKHERNKNGSEPEATVIPPGATDDMPIEGQDDPRSQLMKLTLAHMGCQPELSKFVQGKADSGRDILQAIVYGELTGLTGPKELPNAKSEDEKYTYGLVGRIEGVNAITGESYTAGILYLPAGFHAVFLSEMETQLQQAGKGNVAIQFALEFWSIAASNPSGYSWKAKNKMPMRRSDPLEQLRRRALRGADIKLIGHDPAAA